MIPRRCGGTVIALYHVMNVNVENAAATLVGRRRANEDAFAVVPELGLFLVADGMGGYRGGAIASRTAVAAVVDFVRRHAGDREGTWPFRADRRLSLDENVLQVGIRSAHQAIVTRRTPELAQMGSTLVGLLVRDGVAVVGHIGDSRAYRLRAGTLTQLTRDHSLYADLAAAGHVDVPQSQFEYGNVVTRALGLTDNPEVASHDLADGDVFLLCSDGLTGSVPDELICDMLGALPLSRVCDTLVTEAYERGSHDNITAVVASVTL